MADINQDKSFISTIEKLHPELARWNQYQFDKEAFSKIGIDYFAKGLPLGFLRYYPEDFIVEEIDRHGNIATIDAPTDNPTVPLGMDRTDNLYATMVKAGIPTEKAVNDLSFFYHFDRRSVSYAGLKDTVAVTAQRIFLGKSKYADYIKSRPKNIFLKDFSYEKGKLVPGMLQGNRFTIFVRTKSHIPEPALKPLIDRLNNSGFHNYYSFQRFGRRLNTHKIGYLLLQKNFAKALYWFLFDTSSYEMEIVSKIRKSASYWYGNWDELNRFFNTMPGYFGHERQFIRHLQKNPTDYEGAFRRNRFITEMFIWGFNSYMFNKLLSFYALNNLPPPHTIPFFLFGFKDSSAFRELYRPLLDRLEIDLDSIDPNVFSFLERKNLPEARTIMPVKVNKFKTVEQGVIINFELGSGAYATSFLPNLFNLRHGTPLPDWVKPGHVDTKEAIGYGSSKKAAIDLGLDFGESPVEIQEETKQDEIEAKQDNIEGGLVLPNIEEQQSIDKQDQTTQDQITDENGEIIEGVIPEIIEN